MTSLAVTSSPAQYFYLSTTYNLQHILLTSSQKNCTETSVDQTNRQRKTENKLEMEAEDKKQKLHVIRIFEVINDVLFFFNWVIKRVSFLFLFY